MADTNSKSAGDEQFMKDLIGSRTKMVMTKPPTGASKSLDEILGGETHVEVSADDQQSIDSTGYLEIDIDLFVPSKYQVKHLDESAVEELMASIEDTKGVISPIIARRLENGKFEIVAGHTRWEAEKRQGKTKVAAVIRVMSDEQAAKALAADNLTKKDPTDFEIFKQLHMLFAEGFIKSNSEASRLLGRSRQDIIRYQAFGKLPASVVDLLERQPGLLGASTAKELELMSQEASHLPFVIEGCQRLFDEQLKNQSALLAWIRQKTSDKADRHEFRVTDDKGNAVAKVAVSSKALTISGKGLDLDVLAERLRTVILDCKKA